MIREERIQPLNQKPIRRGRIVLYWMQASQRTECNHALEYAILRSNEMKQPLVVYFGLTDRFPEANQRHYHFMLEGLREVQSSLRERGVKMVVREESPEVGVLKLSGDTSLVVTDRGYLRIQGKWRSHAAERIDCPLIQVETDVIVPVEEASPKEEYSAATFRPKIKKRLEAFLTPLSQHDPKVSSLALDLDSLDLKDPERLISHLDIERGVKRARDFRGGAEQAKSRLRAFLETRLDRYPEDRNDPNLDSLSGMSPYLHFGQISPLHIALEVLKTGSPGTESYLEELIVRRELSMNFVFYNPNYDSWEGLPGWARRSLQEHEGDRREFVYTLEDLEGAKTHDPYWNAAQREMTGMGKMHGYMRMYWGKKILEWSPSPEEGLKNALYLNNKYEIDGRDPNGFAGVAWCWGKHDRPWQKRPIFGNIRYMNAAGLKRKFDADGYVEKIERQIAGAPG